MWGEGVKLYTVKWYLLVSGNQNMYINYTVQLKDCLKKVNGAEGWGGGGLEPESFTLIYKTSLFLLTSWRQIFIKNTW